MSFAITGTIELIKETQFISDKFKKREFVVLTKDTTHPQSISFELHQDKCELLDKYSEGEEISVDFNLNGKKVVNQSGTRYFNNLVVWKLELVNS